MDAEDVGTGQDGSDVGGDGGDAAGFCDGEARGLDGGDGLAEEAFAGEADEERAVKLAEPAKAGEQDEVFMAALAEAEAGVQDDALGGDAGGLGDGEGFAEAGKDGRKDLIAGHGALGEPLAGAAAGVHEDEAAAGLRGDGGHVGVPAEAGDVVDDLSTGASGEAGGVGVVGVDGEDGMGPFAEDAVEDGKEAGLLFVAADGCGVGAGGLGAEIDDVRAVVEGFHGGGDSELGGGGAGMEQAGG